MCLSGPVGRIALVLRQGTRALIGERWAIASSASLYLVVLD